LSHGTQNHAEDFESIAKRLSDLETKLLDTVNRAQESNDKRFAVFESKIDGIASAVCSKETNKSEEDAEDRKRLKERLKEALDQTLDSRGKDQDAEKENWMEYIFGICKPDGRVGKEGSRWSIILVLALP
jgi:hypothetical protein